MATTPAPSQRSTPPERRSTVSIASVPRPENAPGRPTREQSRRRPCVARPVAGVSVHCGSHWSIVLVRTTRRLVSRASRVTASTSRPVPAPGLQVGTSPAASGAAYAGAANASAGSGTGLGSGGRTNGRRSGVAETDSWATPSCSRAPTSDPSTSRVRTRRGCAGSATSTCATRTWAGSGGMALYGCRGTGGGSCTPRCCRAGVAPSRSTVPSWTSSDVGRHPVRSRPITLADPSGRVRSTTSPVEVPDDATVSTRSPDRLVTSASSTPGDLDVGPSRGRQTCRGAGCGGGGARVRSCGRCERDGCRLGADAGRDAGDGERGAAIETVGRHPGHGPRAQPVEELVAAGHRGVVRETGPDGAGAAAGRVAGGPAERPGAAPGDDDGGDDGNGDAHGAGGLHGISSGRAPGWRPLRRGGGRARFRPPATDAVRATDRARVRHARR